MVISSESALMYNVGTFIRKAIIKATVVLPPPGGPANMTSWLRLNPTLYLEWARYGIGSGRGAAVRATATRPNGTGRLDRQPEAETPAYQLIEHVVSVMLVVEPTTVDVLVLLSGFERVLNRFI